MGFSLSPSIDIAEQDLSLTIPNLPSSKTGLVLRADYGPALKIVPLKSESDLVNKFKRPTNLNYKDWYNAWNFLQYASSLYAVRPLDPSATNAGVYLTGGTADGLTPAATVTGTEEGNLYNEDVAELTLSNAIVIEKLAFYNRYVTSVQNLAVAVCSSVDCWNLPLTADIEQIFDPSIQSSNGTILPMSAFFDFEPEWEKGEFAVVVLQKNAEGKYELVAGETYVASYNETGRDVFGHNIYADEIFYNKSKVMYCKVGDSAAAPVNTANNTLIKIDHVSEASVYPKAGIFGDDLVYTGVYTQSDIMNAESSFANPEEFDVNILIAHEMNINGAAEIAASRKDCLAIIPIYDVDAIVGKSASDAVAYINSKYGTRTADANKIFTAWNTYSSIYGNLKYQYDKFNDVNRWMSIGGDVAGLMAQTDANRDPWWAVAGLERGKIKNAIKLAYNASKPHRDDLYVNAVNPIIGVVGEGAAVIWGQRTAIAKPSAFDRVNVRRLLITLEKAIATASRYVLFEFNDEFTRARATGLIEPFLRDVKGRRGVYDFLVICDKSNNTDEVIDRNEMVIDVYIKPTRVAEFIKINMKVTRTDANFAELVGAAAA